MADIVRIRVLEGTQYPMFFYEANGVLKQKARFLSDAELATATAKFPVVCTDVVLVDENEKFVLAKRTHACARGWWWQGGGLNMDKTPEENISNLLRREIKVIPEEVTFLTQFFHHWTDTRERPGEQRLDLILLHYCRVSEEDISKIVLDPGEYDVSSGLMRYDGTHEGMRPVVSHAYKLFKERSG